MNNSDEKVATNKATQEYWNATWANVEPSRIPKSSTVRRWIEANIPPASERLRTCIEIGCYPGKFLSIFGDLGYELNGIDTAQAVHKVPQYLKDHGYKVGTFWQNDFTTFRPPQQFDVVASFGFIEHFVEWPKVLEMHAALVREDGYLIVEVPNFIGAAQRWLHSTFDGTNLSRHHIPAMDVDAWTPILQKYDFLIANQGYFGPFNFWYETDDRNNLQLAIPEMIRLISLPMGLILPKNKRLYSPYGGVVARRTRVPLKHPC